MKRTLIDVNQAAELYGCSASNIRRLISDGKLKPRPSPGSLKMVCRADVIALSETNKAKREYSRPTGGG